LELNLDNHVDALIASDTRKHLKLKKNGKSPGEDYLSSELYKRAPEEFRMGLLQFLNNI